MANDNINAKTQLSDKKSVSLNFSDDMLSLMPQQPSSSPLLPPPLAQRFQQEDASDTKFSDEPPSLNTEKDETSVFSFKTDDLPDLTPEVQNESNRARNVEKTLVGSPIKRTTKDSRKVDDENNEECTEKSNVESIKDDKQRGVSQQQQQQQQQQQRRQQQEGSSAEVSSQAASTSRADVQSSETNAAESSVAGEPKTQREQETAKKLASPARAPLRRSNRISQPPMRFGFDNK